ncbi:MAG: DNA-directed RNA polymerase subunit omega [Bacilli bacterium]|nr:DNA-directed RNA polymerase subunit omega [Bacilli bacterium]
MIHPSIDKLLNKVGSKYLLVNLVAKRVKEIEETEFYQMKENEYKSSKPIGRALEEIAKDLIQIKEN